MSDVHWDNKKCRRDLYDKHLQYIQQNNMPIIDIGDWFCAMQGKNDKRKSAGGLREEYRGDNYFDKLVNIGADYLKPYAKQFAVMTYGNHETSCINHHETDLTARLVDKLNNYGANTQRGKYAGFILLRFWFNDNCHITIKYAYHHGPGNGGRVTRGVLDVNHQAVYLPDAQIVQNGHTHTDYEMSVERSRITNQGREYQETQLYIRTPGYKQEMSCGMGWAVEKGHAIRGQGCREIIFEVSDPSAKTISYGSRKLV